MGIDVGEVDCIEQSELLLTDFMTKNMTKNRNILGTIAEFILGVLLGGVINVN